MGTFDVMCLLTVLLIMTILGGVIFILESTSMWEKFQNFILHIWGGEDED